jgi:hypothetical protein
MKQPTDQEERNEDKKKPEKENPSHGIDPESKEPEMEVDQDRGPRKHALRFLGWRTQASGKRKIRTRKKTIRWRPEMA